VALRRALIPSREALSRVVVRLRQAGSLLRRGSSASFRADIRLLADLLLRGGVLLIIADSAGAPAARVLIQPDADILMTIDRRCLIDSVLRTRIRDELLALCTRLAAASRPLGAMSTVMHTLFAVAYLAIARQTAANYQHWFVQTAAATVVVLLGMLAASVLRRVLTRWLLRHL
jgi:hypothetical protein